jgi:hypothetical protein
MPTIVDSLFLELGIDTAKFNTDQVKALTKIQEFETRAKRAGKGGSDAIKTVGDAFRDLARSTSVGSGISRIEDLSKKVTGLGQSLGVAGGIGAPLGAVTRGIGALLSPVGLGVAAVGALGFGMWELNKDMATVNASLERQRMLTGMGAKNFYALGEAAKFVGGSPAAVIAGVTALQTAIMGMGIGVGNATSQLIGLSRLGVKFDFQKGADIEGLLTRVHALAAERKFGDVEHGGKPLGALRALAAQAGMNDEMFALAANPDSTAAQFQQYVSARAPANVADIMKKSLADQAALGKVDILKDIMAETAYGGEQGFMTAVTNGIAFLGDKLLEIFQVLHDDIAAGIKKIADFFTGAGATKDKVVAAGEAVATGAAALATGGVPNTVAGLVEPYMARGIRNKNPGNLKYAGQPGATGQDAQGFAVFGSWGDGMTAMRRQLALDYRRGETSVAAIISSWAPKGENNTGSYIKAVAKMLGVGANVVLNPSMLERLMGAMVVEENGKRALGALAAANNTHNTVSTSTHEINIGDIHVASAATNGVDMARDMRRSLASQPLLGQLATQVATLSTRGSQ